MTAADRRYWRQFLTKPVAVQPREPVTHPKVAQTVRLEPEVECAELFARRKAIQALADAEAMVAVLRDDLAARRAGGPPKPLPGHFREKLQ